MKNINKKLDWLNIHCDNMFIISTNEEENKFNIRVLHGNKNLERTNLTKYMLNKELDLLEHELSMGRL